MLKDRIAIKKYREYMSGDGDKTLTEYMYYLHDVYDGLGPEEKEDAYLFTLSTFPETIGYAMLKLSSLKINVVERFSAEYKDAYKDWLEDIGASLCMGFGDDKIFLTYAKLYICGMTEHVDTLSKRIEDTFKKRKEDKERSEWMHKKIF